MNREVTLPKYITQGQLCEMLQITRWTVNKWERAGRIKRHVFNGAIRYKLDEVMGMDEADNE